MISVTILLSQNEITEFEVKGHANYGKSGEDLVCAGVSSIMYGIYNALVELCVSGFDYELNEGYFKIIVNESTELIQTILEVAIIQLETVHTSYAKYIKIKKMEV